MGRWKNTQEKGNSKLLWFYCQDNGMDVSMKSPEIQRKDDFINYCFPLTRV